jgi:ketosteroid isomerase-like protein
VVKRLSAEPRILAEPSPFEQAPGKIMPHLSARFFAAVMLAAAIATTSVTHAQSAAAYPEAAPATAPTSAPAPPSAALDAVAAIGAMREGLVDAFNRQDLDRLLSFLSPDVVITWQNAEVSHGPEAVRAYYNRMMKAEKPIVAKVTANPVVDGRQVYGDWALSWGHMQDHFILTDGTDLPFDSRFTATIARREDRWLVTGFHLSVDAFENPVMNEGVRRSGTYGGLGGLAIGLIAGVVGTVVVSRLRRRKPAVPA